MRIWSGRIMWTPYVEILQKLALLRKKSCNNHVLKTFYFSNFYSIMRYGVIHWSSSSHSQRVFIMQKQAIRIMYRLTARSSCKNVFKSNRLLTFLHSRCIRVCTQHLAKFYNAMSHSYSTGLYHHLMPAPPTGVSEKHSIPRLQTI